MKPPTSSHKGRSRRAGRLVYINETGLLSLRDMGSSAAVAGGGGEDVSIPPNSEPNSLAKLLSFSSYYYGEGKEHGEVALFDDVSPGDVAPGDGSVGRSRASKRRRSDPAESTDNWVPAVHPVRPGAVQTEVEDATLSRQNSVVPPLLSQISVISNSGDDVAAGANVRNDSEGKSRAYLMHFLVTNWSIALQQGSHRLGHFWAGGCHKSMLRMRLSPA